MTSSSVNNVYDTLHLLNEELQTNLAALQTSVTPTTPHITCFTASSAQWLAALGMAIWCAIITAHLIHSNRQLNTSRKCALSLLLLVCLWSYCATFADVRRWDKLALNELVDTWRSWVTQDTHVFLGVSVTQVLSLFALTFGFHEVCVIVSGLVRFVGAQMFWWVWWLALVLYPILVLTSTHQKLPSSNGANASWTNLNSPGSWLLYLLLVVLTGARKATTWWSIVSGHDTQTLEPTGTHAPEFTSSFFDVVLSQYARRLMSSPPLHPLLQEPAGANGAPLAATPSPTQPTRTYVWATGALIATVGGSLLITHWSQYLVGFVALLLWARFVHEILLRHADAFNLLRSTSNCTLREHARQFRGHDAVQKAEIAPKNQPPKIQPFLIQPEKPSLSAPAATTNDSARSATGKLGQLHPQDVLKARIQALLLTITLTLLCTRLSGGSVGYALCWSAVVGYTLLVFWEVDVLVWQHGVLPAFHHLTCAADRWHAFVLTMLPPPVRAFAELTTERFLHAIDAAWQGYNVNSHARWGVRAAFTLMLAWVADVRAPVPRYTFRILWLCLTCGLVLLRLRTDVSKRLFESSWTALVAWLRICFVQIWSWATGTRVANTGTSVAKACSSAHGARLLLQGAAFVVTTRMWPQVAWVFPIQFLVWSCVWIFRCSDKSGAAVPPDTQSKITQGIASEHARLFLATAALALCLWLVSRLPLYPDMLGWATLAAVTIAGILFMYGSAQTKLRTGAKIVPTLSPNTVVEEPVPMPVPEPEPEPEPEGAPTNSLPMARRLARVACIMALIHSVALTSVSTHPSSPPAVWLVRGLIDAFRGATWRRQLPFLAISVLSGFDKVVLQRVRAQYMLIMLAVFAAERAVCVSLSDTLPKYGMVGVSWALFCAVAIVVHKLVCAAWCGVGRLARETQVQAQVRAPAETSASVSASTAASGSGTVTTIRTRTCRRIPQLVGIVVVTLVCFVWDPFELFWRTTDDGTDLSADSVFGFWVSITCVFGGTFYAFDVSNKDALAARAPQTNPASTLR